MSRVTSPDDYFDIEEKTLADANATARLHGRGLQRAVVIPPDPRDAEPVDPESIDVPVLSRRTGLPVELEPDADVVLELEEEKQMPDLKECSTRGCKNTFEAYRARKKCDACRDAPVPEKEAQPARPRAERQAKPAPSRTVAQRNTASPIVAVLDDLRAKRDQLDAAIAALEGLV